MRNILVLILLSITAVSCLPEEPNFESFRKVEVERLLSNYDSKRWVLNSRSTNNEQLNLTNCETPRQLIFRYTSSGNDKDSLLYINPSNECTSTNDTLKGYWYVPATLKAETPTDTVVFVWNEIDTGYFKLNSINPEEFEISSFFKEDSLYENFIHFPLTQDEEENSDQ
ncbi:hypothetical protein [Marivirga arenosa]|uniref:Uncharacterized protein n=1 Tax=Marivirga arenosa TaxID=3059076 RepID=A0AA49GDY0_9BACT|nr:MULTISPECIES: hypothetical protein [unclassified Marivirga]WKK84541.2 hypothetical protein QYS48_20665 [Marivirga sp. ABR2-2]WNB16986.1 hypothetical protein QYS47_32505 [Marivirga sp. BKB1-2]